MLPWLKILSYDPSARAFHTFVCSYRSMQKSRPIKKLDGLGMFLVRACGAHAKNFKIFSAG